jgi:hypothetical protein
VLRSSGETTLWVREDSTEAKTSESLEDSKGENLRRNNIFTCAVENSSKGVRRREREQRLRPLVSEILPSHGRRSAQVQESTVAVISAGEGDLDHWFLCPGES